MKYPKSVLPWISLLLLTVLLQTNSAYGFDEKKPSLYETELLRHINQYRITNGLNPLSADGILNRLAKSHSRYMDENSILCHDNFDDRFRECGRSSCVENVGWNSQTPEAQFRAWKTSKGHNANLLNKNIRYAGLSKVGAYVTFFACD